MYIDEKVLKVKYVGFSRKCTWRFYVCRKQVVIVHESFVLNIVSTDVVAIIHGSFVLEWVCTVLVGKVQGALRVHPVESLLVDGIYIYI